MVVRQRDVHHGADLHLAVDRHRAVLCLVQTKDANLRVVDDRRGEQGAEHTTVGDGKGAAGEVIHGQLAVARALGHGRNVLADLHNALGFGILHVWHHEPRVARHGDAHVHIVLVDNGVAVDLRIHSGVRLQRQTRRLHEKRHVRQLHPMLFFHPILETLTEGRNGRHVDLVEGGEVRRLLL